jgi:hypothetical protein
MSYHPSILVQRAWDKPPRCLSGFAVNPLRVPLAGTLVFDDLGYFEVACICGSKSWHVLGYPDQINAFICPLSLKCAQCGHTALLFDIAKHGYDSECENGCYSLRGDGDAENLSCSHCNGITFEVFPRFSYQIGPIEEMSPEALSHIEDFFDGFGLVVRCTKCGKIESPVDYECA